MRIKAWYMEAYPGDELGRELDGHVTFNQLLKCLRLHGNVYQLLGEADSVIRERVFEQLSAILGCDYEQVYQLWLSA